MSIVALSLLPASDVPIIHCSESGLERPVPAIVKPLVQQYKHTHTHKKIHTHWKVKRVTNEDETYE